MTDTASYLENPDEDDIHLARWLLGGFVLLTSASALIPDEWDGIGLAEFRAQLKEQYEVIIRDWLQTYHIPWLESRGIPVGVSGTPLALNNAINEAIRDTTDLHRSMQEAFSTGGFNQWGSPTHQGQILKDMARIAGDRLNEQVATRLQQAGAFTGRQRWRTANENSRHAELNLQVGPWRFGGQTITHPRFDPQNPQAWSNCSCFVEYEWEAEDGTTGWL